MKFSAIIKKKKNRQPDRRNGAPDRAASPIQPVKVRVVFPPLCSGNLHPFPLDRLDFCRAIALPTTGNRKENCFPLSSAPFYGKTGSTGVPAALVLCGGSAPTPPTSSKEQEGGSAFLLPLPFGGLRGRGGFRFQPFQAFQCLPCLFRVQPFQFHIVFCPAL